MQDISKKSIWCYLTTNPVLQLEHHCQVPEKNPDVGVMLPVNPAPLCQAALRSGESHSIIPPLRSPLFLSLPVAQGPSTKLKMADHEENWRLRKRSGLHSKLFHFLLPLPFKNLNFILFSHSTPMKRTIASHPQMPAPLFKGTGSPKALQKKCYTKR